MEVERQSEGGGASPVRLGLLSTAHINDRCIHQVMPHISGVRLLGVASRSQAKAEEYGQRHGIPKCYGSYELLLSDPDMDAVYIPLPNSLHVEWTRKALVSGKHVLCEKPLTSNPSEALATQELAQKLGLHVAEAMHYRHHPVLKDLVASIRGGLVGKIKEVNVSFVWDLNDENDIRLSRELDGGALMDVGCYCLDFIRWVTGDDHPSVLKAEAVWSLHDAPVDTAVRCTLSCANGIPARFYCDLRAEGFDCWAGISGERGSLLLRFPFLPVVADSGTPHILFAFEADGKRREVNVPAQTSYLYQLQDFRDTIKAGPEVSNQTKPDFYYNAALLAEIKNKMRESSARACVEPISE